ncbi:MAG TPA: prepilin peptidase [Candidatus Paceibacterota bacterium]|nr:prepilin peptidase [Candidatus Paceibacterota bacterium]
MDYFTVSAIFVFGLIIGSFLNVVIFRFNTGMTVSRGRSACFSCGKTLEWYELIPVASFLMQKGACRKCRSRISWQYPLVELSGGITLVLAYILTPGAFVTASGFVSFVLLSILLCLYIVIVTYDIRHKIIPDAFSYAAGATALLMMGQGGLFAGRIDPTQAVAGPALFLFFWAFWYFSKGKWMGLGDGKLALSIGWVLGLAGGVTALLFSFWIGAVISLAIMAVERIRGNKRLGMRSEIPFGPFLIIGFLIVLIFRVDIQALLSYLAL